jgi:regulator of sirC expression with transglutaminase-like and TPR domain
MDNQAKNREMQALISLVDEPDRLVFKDIAERIHSFGPEAIPLLEKEWEQTLNPAIQKRIENLIHSIQFEEVSGAFRHWVEGGCKDLFEGWMILVRFQYPQVNEEDLHYEINQIRKDIWLEINENLTALEQVKVFNHVFYDIHGFSGDTETYHAPENSFLNKVLHSRKGNPLSLSLIYLMLAQSLDLPVFGVNLPEHFVLAYTGNTFDPQTMETGKQSVLFYINAFSRGAVFSRKDVEDFVRQLKLESHPGYYEPCNNRDMIKRMLNNLVIAFEKAGSAQKAREMDQLRKILNGD